MAGRVTKGGALLPAVPSKVSVRTDIRAAWLTCSALRCHMPVSAGMPAAVAAAMHWLRNELLPQLPQWAQRLLKASYTALPVGTTLVLQSVLAASLAIVAALLLRPKVLRAGLKVRHSYCCVLPIFPCLRARS